MKSIIVVTVIAVIIGVICGVGIVFVNRSTDEMENRLNLCIAAAEAENFSLAKQRLADTKKAWEQSRSILMMYTDQSILDDIDDYLAHMEALADHHKDEFVPTAVLCLCKCKELDNREKISVYSWF